MVIYREEYGRMVKSRAGKRGEEGLVQAGEIPLAKTLAKKFKPPTRAQINLVDAALAIQAEPDAAERAYMARQLVLCTLPHSDPGDSARSEEHTSELQS